MFLEIFSLFFGEVSDNWGHDGVPVARENSRRFARSPNDV